MLRRIDSIIEKIEQTVSVVLFLTLVAVVCWGVICRYILRIPFISAEELARYLMIYCVYLGTSIGVRLKTHIGVEVFVQALPEKPKKIVNNIAQYLSMIMFLILFVLSIMMMQQFIQTGQITTITKVPMYIIYSCIPLSMILSVFHSFCNIYFDIRTSKEVV